MLARQTHTPIGKGRKWTIADVAIQVGKSVWTHEWRSTTLKKKGKRARRKQEMMILVKTDPCVGGMGVVARRRNDDATKCLNSSITRKMKDAAPTTAWHRYLPRIDPQGWIANNMNPS